MPMIPSPIHFLAYTRLFWPGVEPRGSAGGSYYKSRFAYDFCRAMQRRFWTEKNCPINSVSLLKSRGPCAQRAAWASVWSKTKFRCP